MIRPLLTALALALACTLAAADAVLPAGLAPGNVGVKTDSQGSIWMFQPNATVNVQNSLLNWGYGLTSDSGEEFQPRGQPQVSKDGSLAAFSGAIGQLQVDRIMRFDAKTGVVRWVEIVRNPGSTPYSGSIGFNFRLQNQSGGVVSETGNPVSTGLGAKEGALIITRNPSWRVNITEMVLLLADPTAKLKPTLMNQNNYEFAVMYPLAIPAGKAVAVMHAVALRQMGGAADTKEAQRLLAVARARNFTADLPPGLRRLIVNWRAGALADDDAPSAAIPEELLAVRGERDLLALGAATRLRGTSAGKDLAIEFDGRKVPIPWEQLFALAGGDRTGRVFLQDGQSLPGAISGSPVVFTLASGQAVSVAPDRLGWLLRAPKSSAGATDAPVLVETADGLRLRARAPDTARIAAATPWGVIDLRLADVAALHPAEGGGHAVRLADGSRFHAYLAGEDLALDTPLLGARRVRVDQLVSIATPAAKQAGEDDAGDEPKTPFALAAGGQLLVGAVELPELHVRLSGNRLPVAPSQIRLLVNREIAENAERRSATPAVRLELWGGDVLEGVLDEAVLPIRVGGSLLSVPVAELVEVHVPVPVIAAATRTRIVELIAQLGDADWGKREAASKSLVELGAVVRRPAEEALAATADPEVKLRLENLLGALP